MAVCTGEEVTPGSAESTISREQATVCAILMLNKDSRSYSPQANGKKLSACFSRMMKVPFLGSWDAALHSSCLGGWLSVIALGPPHFRGQFLGCL